MAVGLGSVDMPVPAVAEWEWLNWTFPHAVHAGDTIYARWTLTQKRAPVGGAPTAIVVWRVDVHTAGGALCAEGEVGASVLRRAAAAAPERAEEPVASGQAAPRRRRRRRPAGADGAKSPAEAKAAAAVEAPVAVSPPPASARRRRRRRPASAAPAHAGDGRASAAPPQAAPAAAPVSDGPAGVSAATAVGSSQNPLTRAIRRLRRP